MAILERYSTSFFNSIAITVSNAFLIEQPGIETVRNVRDNFVITFIHKQNRETHFHQLSVTFLTGSKIHYPYLISRWPPEINQCSTYKPIGIVHFFVFRTAETGVKLFS